MSPLGYKRLFGPCRRSDRSIPESRPSSGNVCFAPDFVCFTPESGRGRHPRRSGSRTVRISTALDSRNGQNPAQPLGKCPKPIGPGASLQWVMGGGSEIDAIPTRIARISADNDGSGGRMGHDLRPVRRSFPRLVCLTPRRAEDLNRRCSGVAMLQIAVAIVECRESACGYKRKLLALEIMSALPPEADIPVPRLDFRL